MQKNIDRIVAWWLRQNSWHYLWIPVVAAILLTELVVCGMSLLLLGRIDSGYLLTGLVAAGLVSLVVCATLFYLAGRLRESEKRYLLLVENAEIPVLIISLTEGVVLFANNCAAEYFGVHPDEACGLFARDFWADAKERDRYIATLEKHHRVSGYEAELRTRGGETKWALLSSHVMNYMNSRALFTVFADITARRQQDAELTQLSEALKQCSETIVLADTSHRFQYVNPAFTKIFGYTADEVKGQPLSLLEVPGDPIRGAGFQGEVVRRAKDGRAVPVLLKVSPIKDKDHNDIGLVGIMSDLTDLKKAAESLRESEEKLRGLYDLSPLGIALTDMQGRYIEFNESFRTICGYPADELKSLDYWTLTPKEYEHQEALQLESLAGTGRYGPYEKTYRQKDGTLIPIRLNGMLVTGQDGQQYIWSLVEDITSRKQHEEKLERIAHYDVLTDIPNRVLLADRMKQAMAQTVRDQTMLAVCYLDLDGFKSINDQFGHDTGDQILIEIAKRIQGAIRGGDTVARLGGDEFVVLLLGLERGNECVTTLERLLEAIAQPIYIKEKLFTLSASIGVSIYPLDFEDVDTLLRHADQAMYVAKQSGRNRYYLHDTEQDQRSRIQQALLGQIKQGLGLGQFELHYQPKVEMSSRRLVGAEALIRWRHPERGLLLPIEFLGAIENTVLDVEIGDWVIVTALEQVNQWRLAGLDIEVSINISAHHLESPQFVAKLEQRLSHYPNLPAGCFQIEVLETAALQDVSKVTSIIEACRQIGVGFALDDFGTGYSSLLYLNHLPVDTLKIDQSFVRGMLEDKGDMAIVHGIIALAQAFNRNTVAEGIETESHYQALLKMGCDIGQGYGIARPMPADSLLEWSKNTTPGKK
jgi:diguanylate cyclase (GGDEF)-like protein/PAS domain S-box-containing protein